MQKFSFIDGGVTSPKGFRANAVKCGIKDPSKLRLDLALICSDRPTVAAATFTTNKMKAAPVLLCEKRFRNADIRAIIANSGNANACTGPGGVVNARAMTDTTASELGLRSNQILVASTGIIGLPMPMERLLPRIPSLVAGLDTSAQSALNASDAILTSDTRRKVSAVEMQLGGKTIRIGAMAKGAGMICPNMATMLAFVTTDANVSRTDLQKAVKRAVDLSFNRISIDGDTSTNDTVIVLANGASGQRPMVPTSAHFKIFQAGLEAVLLDLAKKIVRDGERVTKFVQINVHGAKSAADARLVARTVANSLLVKCSFNGGDPNWGRIMHAVGYSGADVMESTTDVYFGGLIATENGVAANTPIEELRAVTAKRDFTICINLHRGKHEHTVYTSDISQQYVDFNTAEYAVPSAAPKQKMAVD